MFTVCMALIHILINGQNRIEFPVFRPLIVFFFAVRTQTLAVYMTLIHPKPAARITWRFSLQNSGSKTAFLNIDAIYRCILRESY